MGGDSSLQRDRVTDTKTAPEGGLTVASRTLEFIFGYEIGKIADGIYAHCSSNGVTPRSCVPFATRLQWCCFFKLTFTATDGNCIVCLDFVK